MTQGQAQYVKMLRQGGHSYSRIAELYRKKYDSSPTYGRDLTFDAAVLLGEDLGDWNDE